MSEDVNVELEVMQDLQGKCNNPQNVELVEVMQDLQGKCSNPQQHQGSADLVGQIIEHDDKRKRKLIEIYNEMERFLIDINGDKVEEELKTEFGDVSREIQELKKLLEMDECPIVVAGEISSGKSSLINLILGRDILPQKILPCTTTICRIRNKAQTAISVTTEDDRKEEIEISPEADDQTLKNELKKYVSRKSDQKNYKYVDIALPIPLLKSHHLIIDTPGIGTSEELTERLLDYLPNAMAFIYVINSINAGGMQPDRLLTIFQKQKERMKSNKMHEFDTSTTIFVCNKWDQIDLEEEEEVLRFICETLDKSWPHFDPKEQLYKLSVLEQFRGSADLVGQIIEQDDKRKRKLIEIYSDMKKLMGDITGDNVEEALRTELGDVGEQIEKYKEQLGMDECPIVVAGETSSGKSSLINLILGRDILPQQLLSCTTTICRVRNKYKTTISVTTEDNKQMEIEISPDADDRTLKEELKKYVSRKSDEENYKYVDIGLPIPLLKNHHLIIDTPGIGTSEELTDRLLDFLPNAMAFIYVINCGNAGGLQSDRLLKIFENQRDRMRRNEMHEFDTKTTIFVCNKWDQVDSEEEDDVWRFICETLEKSWPHFNPKEQLYKLSVKEERDMKRKQQDFTEKFMKLLDGIEKLIPASLEAKAARHARWQNLIMQKIYGRIVEKIVFSKKPSEEKNKRNLEVEKAILDLKPQLKTIKQDIKQNAKEKCKDISKRLYKHLQEQSTFDRISKFSVHEYPEGRYKWFVKEKSRELIVNRINEEIRKWCRNENMETLESELDELLKTKLRTLESKIKNIVKEPFHFELSLKYAQSKDNVIEDRNFLDAYSDTVLSVPVLVMAFPLSFTITALLAPILIPLVIKDVYDRMGNYKDNKHEFFQHLCKDLMKDLCEKDIQNIINEGYLNRFNKKVDYLFDKVIPSQIDAEQTSIKNIINDFRSSREIREKYDPLTCQCKMILGQILLVDMEFFSGCEIQEDETYEQMRIGVGSYSDVFKNRVHIVDEKREVAIKRLKHPFEDDPEVYIQLSEVRILRQLKHNNIVELYGMSFDVSSDGSKHLNIYMELCDDNLENIVIKKQGNPKSALDCYESLSKNNCLKNFDFYINMMAGVCKGLSYIHEQDFVHRDLKLSNILVKDRTPKIADVGIAKETWLVTGTLVGTPSTIAPEVFAKKLYSTEADIYSVGILLWEMWYGRPAYTKIINEAGKYKYMHDFSYELHDYVKGGNRPDFDFGNKPPELLRNLIQNCWSADVTTRPTAEEVWLELVYNIGFRIE